LAIGVTAVTDPRNASPDEDQWRGVDEGWGRQAVEFATLSEPTNCREYVTMHHELGVGTGDRLLDIACGSGLAVELAGLRGALGAGIDASPRLIAVARDRSPNADLRVGDMNALPWGDGAFDVVTSFRGIWGTTPGAVAEAHRVLVPGGRIGLTVWGHIKASPGAWAFAPFALAAEPKVQNQAAMVALGRPGAGEALLVDMGFTDVRRIGVPFVFEFADPEAYARALASTGPAFEAIQAVGEKEFLESAVELGRQQIREGLPLRAPIALVGYIAAKPLRLTPRSSDGAAPAAEQAPAGFLSAPSPAPAAQRMFDEDLGGVGYVMNVSRLWAHLPTALEGLSELMGESTRVGSLSFAQRAVLVTAAASALGDSYCSMAWGKKLAEAKGPDVAAAVIGGGSEGLDHAEQALAHWARLMTRDPNAISADDVQALRDVGFDDRQIFAITVFVALRLAFSTVNDALGAVPDRELSAAAPESVRSAVTFGRHPSTDQG
jgi:SAM-dependent methyltransferase/alkylhydroperoxidase family enzyme